METPVQVEDWRRCPLQGLGLGLSDVWARTRGRSRKPGITRHDEGAGRADQTGKECTRRILLAEALKILISAKDTLNLTTITNMATSGMNDLYNVITGVCMSTETHPYH